MRILITDLDGTLLHPQNYTSAPALPALKELGRLEIPVIFCTSKTRAETEHWRRSLGNSDPFIVENGGAVYAPHGYFPCRIDGVEERGPYDVIEIGTPYTELVETLEDASKESGCQVLGFHNMSVADVAIRTLLPVSQSGLAKQREYDEPFEILGPWGTHKLLEAIERRGKRWTRGDRFYHVTGDNNKAKAVRLLAAWYRKAFGELTMVGVGNAHNDADFLRTVDVPLVVQSRFAAALRKAVPHAVVSACRGPRGWNELVLQTLGVPLAGAAAHAI